MSTVIRETGAVLREFLLATIVLIGVVECVCRVAGPVERGEVVGIQEKTPLGLVDARDGLHYTATAGVRMRANVRAHWRSGLTGSEHFIETDALGCRGEGITADGDRILVVGDSVTAALELSEKETFVRQFEQAVREKGRSIQVVNCGVSGASTVDEVGRLAELLPVVKPKVVVLQYFVNDHQRSQTIFLSPLPSPFNHLRSAKLLSQIWGRVKMEQEDFRTRGLVPDETLKDWRVDVEKRLEEDWSGEPTFRGFLTDYFDHVGAAWSMGAWKYLEPHFVNAKKFTDEARARLVIVSFPLALQLDHPDWPAYPQARLGEIAKNLDIPYLDLLPAMQAAKDGGAVLYSPEDALHPNAAGHRVAAEQLSNLFERERILETPSTP